MRRRTLLSSSGGIDPTTGRGTIGDYEVVDLGLPSGLLWATCNVGATKEEEYGNYYQWGTGDVTYEYENQYHTGGSDMDYTLPLSADTATQVMGERWRMPRWYELIELTGNTNYSWTTINGINGAKLTSKTNPNAYVFLPAAGCYDYEGELKDNGSSGHTWSSTPYSTTYYAYRMNFNKKYAVMNSSSNRYDECSVRGVYATKLGKPMPPMSVLFVNKNDTTQKQIFEQDDWPSASDWTPIGIVVVPSSHNRYGDGTNGIMSLGCLDYNGTMQTSGTTDNTTLIWHNYDNTIPSEIINRSCDGTNDYCYVQLQADSGSTTLSYSNDKPHMLYPYTDLTATEHSVITTGSLSDYDGVGNTNILSANTPSAYPYFAAVACRKFKTLGTSAGDWYLPAEGELAYLPSIRYQVNDTISALNAKYGNVGLQLSMNTYWSSSGEYLQYVWFMSPYNGRVDHQHQNNSLIVRAFMRF